MHREYEIFEVLPNGSSIRVARVSGWEFAQVVLEQLAKRTSNECFAADAKSHEVVAQLNVPRAKWCVFQIAYDEGSGLARAEILRRLGHSVISVVGNEKAKLLLNSVQYYDLFIVGGTAPEEARREMVDWLKEKYPKVKILALNPSHQPLLGADYNVTEDDPEKWPPIVAQR